MQKYPIQADSPSFTSGFGEAFTSSPRKSASLLPSESTSWLSTGRAGLSKKLLGTPLLGKVLARIQTHGGWNWPDVPVCFVSDLHADRHALALTLRDLGLVDSESNLKATAKLHQTHLIVGGDCLDKGPSNLALLDALGSLRSQGVEFELLAGNHDLRLFFGLKAFRSQQIGDSHFTVRMMPKVLDLFQEALSLQTAPIEIPSEDFCKQTILPHPQWRSAFEQNCAAWMSEKAMKKEIQSTAKKVAQLDANLADRGLSYRDLYRAILICESLFIRPAGRYAWFFRDMKLMSQKGGFIFTHAGLCDEVARLLARSGVGRVNQLFSDGLEEGGLTKLYFGPLFNSVRTKYRETDFNLTAGPVEALNTKGIQAVVHGHRSRSQGQRLAMRRGLIHFEADVTLDAHSRKKEGFQGPGVGALMIHPEGCVKGHSADYPFIKSFCPVDWALP